MPRQKPCCTNWKVRRLHDGIFHHFDPGAGGAFAAMGRRNEAIAQFQQILQANPDDPGVKQKPQELQGAPASR